MKRKRHWMRDRLGRRGVAAVEFAIIVPFLLVLFIGAIEIATLYRTSLKLNSVVADVAGMIAISGGVSANTASAGVTSLNDVCKGVAMGLVPFPAAGMTLNIASITQEPTGGYDSWEQDNVLTSAGGCKPGPASGVILGSSIYTKVTSGGSTAVLKVACDNVIIVQAKLTYPGIFGIIMQTPPTLTQTDYYRWNYTSATNELLCSDCMVVNKSILKCLS